MYISLASPIVNARKSTNNTVCLAPKSRSNQSSEFQDRSDTISPALHPPITNSKSACAQYKTNVNHQAMQNNLQIPETHSITPLLSSFFCCSDPRPIILPSLPMEAPGLSMWPLKVRLNQPLTRPGELPAISV